MIKHTPLRLMVKVHQGRYRIPHRKTDDPSDSSEEQQNTTKVRFGEGMQRRECSRAEGFADTFFCYYYFTQNITLTAVKARTLLS